MILLLKKYIKDYKLQVVSVMIFALLEAFGQTYLPRMFRDIIDNGVAKNNLDYVWNAGFKMIAITCTIAVCMVISSYFSAYVTAAFTSKVRGDIFKKVQTFTELDFLRFSKESLLTRTTSDTTQMQIVMINLLRSVLTVPFIGVFALINCALLNPLLTLFIIAGFGISIYLIVRNTNKSMPVFAELQGRVDRIGMLMNEKLTGARSIRAFNRQDYEIKKLTEANDSAMEAALEANAHVVFLFPLMQVIMSFAIVLILLCGSLQIKYKLVDISLLLIFIQYCLMISTVLMPISSIVNTLPKARVAAQRVNEVFDYEPVIKEPEYTESIAEPMGEVVFDNVHFGYTGAQDLVLHDITFTAPAGKTTAIVGATGSGKSTLIKLIMRFFDVNYYGSIKIDGVDIRNMRTHDLRNLVSYAPQKATLFGGTILDNLRTANDNINETDALRACDIAQVSEFLESKGETLDMKLSQGGGNISGGQRQRVSLARAFAKDAPIYLLDDSFSALDFKTDSKIRKAMKLSLVGKTVLIVAQRLNTIMHADQIIVLDAGKIAGKGTHEQLLETCAIYRQTYESQVFQEKGGESVE